MFNSVEDGYASSELESNCSFSRKRPSDSMKCDKLPPYKKPTVPGPAGGPGVPSSTIIGHRGSFLSTEASKEELYRERSHYLAMDAHSRHNKMINDYIRYYGGSLKDFNKKAFLHKTDFDVIRENNQFLWNEDKNLSWEQRLAKKYWDKLFKEYCIADLRLFKENKIGMRWRIEKEVVGGKGQFICGNKHCSVNEDLTSWEVNFVYKEHDEKKNALVKLRLCPDCSYKLNFCKKHRKISRSKKSHSVSKEITVNKSETETHGSPDSNSQRKDDSGIWSQEVKVDENDRQNEFDDYFKDMFL